jgi:hypothetical protein
MDDDASLEEKLAQARREERRAMLEKWFWVAFVVPYMIWLGRSVAVVGLLSVYALVITMRGVQQAAKSEIAGYENPPSEGEDG